MKVNLFVFGVKKLRIKEKEVKNIIKEHNLDPYRVSSEEKQKLLDNISEHIYTESIPFYVIKTIIITATFILTLAILKIYIASQIYLTSFKINKKLNEFYSLKSENNILKTKIEKIKFQHRIEDFMFWKEK